MHKKIMPFLFFACLISISFLQGSIAAKRTVVNIPFFLDQTPFKTAIKSLDRNNSTILLDNGTLWSIDLKSLTHWEVNDRVVLVTSYKSTFHNATFYLKNLSKETDKLVEVTLINYILDEAKTVFRAGQRYFHEPVYPRMFYLYQPSNGSGQWITVAKEDVKIVESWPEGSPVIVQIFDEIREQNEVILSIESLCIINPINGSQIVAYPTPLYGSWTEG